MLRDEADELQTVAVESERFTIGRLSSNDLPLGHDQEVSRGHLSIGKRGASFILSDQGLPRNGTFVIGQRRLTDGAIIRVGGVVES